MNKKLQKNSSGEFKYIPLEGEEVMAVSDLGCAAALITAGFSLLTLDRANPHKVKFILAVRQE